MALQRAFPMPTGVVETFFTTMRLTTNLLGGNKPFAEDEGGKDHGAGASKVGTSASLAHKLAGSLHRSARVNGADGYHQKTISETQNAFGSAGWRLRCCGCVWPKKSRGEVEGQGRDLHSEATTTEA